MLKQKLKRFLSCILSVLTVFGCLTESLSVFAEKIELPNGREGEIITAEAVFGRHTVQPSGEGYNRFLMYDGVPKADDFAYWVYEDTGEKYPAYCVSPTKPGVTELGSYDVNVKELTTDPKLYWILRHGYPYNTPEELGVSDEDEAYAATKMALWTSLNGWDLNKWAVNPNCTVPGDHSDVLAALKNIVAAAAKDEVLGVPNYHVTIVPESSKLVIDSVDSDYYSVTYHFEYDERINPLSVQVQWKSTQPPGAKITREDNTETGYFKIDEKVKLLVPKDWVDQQTGSQTVSLAMFFTSWMRPAMQAYAINLDASQKNAQNYLFSTPEIWKEKVEVSAVFSPSVSQSPDLMIYKDDEGTPLAGAVFSVTDENGAELGPITTASDGKARLTLPKEGRYTVIETAAPDGYKLDSTPYVVTVQDGQTGEVTLNISNSQKGSLQVRKVDAVTGEALENATFRITNPAGVSSDYTTDSTGTVVINDAEVGNWVVEEIIAPDGYQITVGEMHGTVQYGQMTTIVVKDNANPGVKLMKLDEKTKEPLAGATFELYQQGNLIASGTTDHNGVLEFLDLDAGWYTVKEVSAPDGYIANTEEQNVQLEPNKITELTFLNQRKPSIEITKVDSQTDEPLAGAQITVEQADGAEIGTFVTDADGKIVLEDMAEGAYVITEVVAPDGYLLDDTHHTIEVSAGETAQLTLENVPKPGLEILKVDEDTGVPLIGAKFRISKPDVPGSEQVYMTNDQGIIFLEDQDVNAYVIEEIEAPEGYILNSKPITVQLNPGERKEVRITNEAKPGLALMKIDADTKLPLPGAELRVSKADGSVVGEYITDENGRVFLENLEAGTYTVEELTAPSGYQLETQKQSITLEAGRTGELVFTNKLKPGLEITKVVTGTDQVIAGVRFEVSYADGEKIGEYETNDTGRIFIPDLEPGIYSVKEISVPDEYILDSTVRNVKLESGKTARLLFSNERKPGLELLKLDAQTLAPLAGAELRVTKAENNELVGEYTTQTNGRVFIPNLEPGVYVVEETKAPDGYVLESQQQNVTLKAGETASVTFYNTIKAGLEILKVDEDTGEPLDGAKIRLSTAEGAVVGEYITQGGGRIFVEDLQPGLYVLEETAAPGGYILDPQKRTVQIEAGRTTKVSFTNKQAPGLEILKTDTETGLPLAGAKFKISKPDGSTIGEYVTGEDGKINLTNLAPGVYEIEEIEAPAGYVLNPQKKSITLESGKTASITFVNIKNPTLTILKLDTTTNSPLAGAIFNVQIKNGKNLGNFTSDENGLVELTGLEPGIYVISEITAPDGYQITNLPQEVTLNSGDTVTVEVRDEALSPLYIKKIDSKDGTPVEGAKFRVEHMNGALVGEYTTDRYGWITIPELTPGWYLVTELSAPDGYVVDSTPKRVQVKLGEPAIVEFTNAPLGDLVIRKVDSVTGDPLAGAKFEISRSDGGFFLQETSDENGMIVVSNLEPGSYVVTEIEAPDGYIISTSPIIFEMTAEKSVTLTFENTPKSSLTIYKQDTDGNPVAGVTFRIEKPDGQFVAEGTTDASGRFILTDLEPGSYLVRETRVPDGMILDPNAKTVTIQEGKPASVTFVNEYQGDLVIIKQDTDGNPVADVTFRIEKPNGEFVKEVTTDGTGKAVISDLDSGDYVVTEIRVPDGMLLDTTPKNVTIKDGETASVTFINDTRSGIRIVKTVEQTGKPLKGVEFSIERDNGERIGTYTTDADGIIYVELDPGTYVVREVSAPDGYDVDSAPRTVIVKPNVPTVLEYEDAKMGGIRIQKVDSQTEEGIPGVRILVTNDDGDTIGIYETDQDGYIEIEKELPDGTYYLEEIEAAPGYEIDRIKKRIKIVDGKATDVEWENAKERGQIQIIKRSFDANPYNNLPAGSLLEGAIFEISRADTGRVVDYISTDYRGVAASDLLPIGRYKIREVTPPPYYLLNPREFEVELKIPNDIVQIEVYDQSADLDVTIQKTGNQQVHGGSQMRYDFSNIANHSNVPLESFYWHDQIPTNAVTLNAIKTGTYNENLTYQIVYRTNKNSTWRVLAGGLNTLQSYDIDCTGSRMGFAWDEYITEFRFEFGNVGAGFHSTSNPAILVTVSGRLPNGQQFANRADAGGSYYGKWITNSYTWVTTVITPSRPVSYPKTGY